MVRDVTPFVAVRVPPWLDRKQVQARAEKDGITEDEARAKLFNEDEEDDK